MHLLGENTKPSSQTRGPKKASETTAQTQLPPYPLRGGGPAPEALPWASSHTPCSAAQSMVKDRLTALPIVCLQTLAVKCHLTCKAVAGSEMGHLHKTRQTPAPAPEQVLRTAFRCTSNCSWGFRLAAHVREQPKGLRPPLSLSQRQEENPPSLPRHMKAAFCGTGLSAGGSYAVFSGIRFQLLTPCEIRS